MGPGTDPTGMQSLWGAAGPHRGRPRTPSPRRGPPATPEPPCKGKLRVGRLRREGREVKGGLGSSVPCRAPAGTEGRGRLAVCASPRESPALGHLPARPSGRGGSGGFLCVSRCRVALSGSGCPLHPPLFPSPPAPCYFLPLLPPPPSFPLYLFEDSHIHFFLCFLVEL